MPRQTRRYIFFAVAILAGIGAGIALGWAVDPQRSDRSGPQTLDMAYQTDYVLMVSVLHQSEGDIFSSIKRLSFLDEQDPVRLVNAAVNHAENSQYAPDDLQLMRSLQADLQAIVPSPQ